MTDPRDPHTLDALHDFMAAVLRPGQPPVIDIATRRQVEAVPTPIADEVHRVPTCVRRSIPTLPEVRLSPAASRAIATAIGDFREQLGDDSGRAPVLEPAYLDDGRVSFAVVVTMPVEKLNAWAVPPVSETAQAAITEAVGDGMPLGTTTK